MAGGFQSRPAIHGSAGEIRLIPATGSVVLTDFDNIDPAVTISSEGIAIKKDGGSSSFEDAFGDKISWSDTLNVEFEFTVGEMTPEIIALGAGRLPSEVDTATPGTAKIPLWASGSKVRWAAKISGRRGAKTLVYLLQQCEVMADELPGFVKDKAGTKFKLIASMNNGESPGEYLEIDD